VNNFIKNKNLFDCKNKILKDFFDKFEYPWQLISELKNFIQNIILSGLKGYIEIEKGVFVGDNVKIHKSAVILPPTIIGSNTEIRPNAYLRGNVIIGENCVIGNSTELKECILLNNVQVPHYNYVGNSVLGNFSHMGAGSICSNLKSDGKNVVIHGDKDYETGLRKVGAILGDFADVGCNCVLNPGTIIGKNSSIYPLTSLRGVIQENSIVKSMKEIVKRK